HKLRFRRRPAALRVSPGSHRLRPLQLRRKARRPALPRQPATRSGGATLHHAGFRLDRGAEPVGRPLDDLTELAGAFGSEAYDSRSTRIGSRRAARRAGTSEARAATTATIATTPRSVAASVAETPYNRPAITRRRASARATPPTQARPTTRSPW